MTIELKLDTQALSSLIEQDPTFRASIQQSVLQNIVNRYVKNADSSIDMIMERSINKLRDEVLDRYTFKAPNWEGTRKLKEHVKTDIFGVLDDELKLQVQELTKKSRDVIDESIKAAFEKLDKGHIDRKIESYLNRYTNEYIAAELERRFKAALSQFTAN